MFQSRNREAFQFRWNNRVPSTYGDDEVSISQSRGFSVQVPPLLAASRDTSVSISQSRGFSVQARHVGYRHAQLTLVSISQSRGFSVQVKHLHRFYRMPRSLFQSRNRDAFHFRLSKITGTQPATCRFQSRNRDAFHFRVARFRLDSTPRRGFQSRNRDAFHFRSSALTTILSKLGQLDVSISQSRCFSFQEIVAELLATDSV